jgi:hypothetical protein
MRPELLATSLDARAERHPDFVKQFKDIRSKLDSIKARLDALKAMFSWLNNATWEMKKKKKVPQPWPAVDLPDYSTDMVDDISAECKRALPSRVRLSDLQQFLKVIDEKIKPLYRDEIALEKARKKILQKAYHKVLAGASVVCVTCVGAGSALLNQLKFTLVISDEATQAPEHAILIPLSRMAQAGHTGDVVYVHALIFIPATCIPIISCDHYLISDEFTYIASITPSTAPRAWTGAPPSSAGPRRSTPSPPSRARPTPRTGRRHGGGWRTQHGAWSTAALRRRRGTTLLTRGLSWYVLYFRSNTHASI